MIHRKHKFVLYLKPKLFDHIQIANLVYTGIKCIEKTEKKKGRAGLQIVYISTNIPSKKLKLPKTYTTIEDIAVESSIGRREIIFTAIYRPCT